MSFPLLHPHEEVPDRYYPKCPGCGMRMTTGDTCIRFYDRNGYYSGEACSEKCSKVLPGQGASANYKPDYREDDDD